MDELPLKSQLKSSVHTRESNIVHLFSSASFRISRFLTKYLFHFQFDVAVFNTMECWDNGKALCFNSQEFQNFYLQ